MRANLARDPRILRRSETTEGVINLYDGTSLYNLSYVALSKRTKLFNLSRTFPFDHFLLLGLTTGSSILRFLRGRRPSCVLLGWHLFYQICLVNKILIKQIKEF